MKPSDGSLSRRRHPIIDATTHGGIRSGILIAVGLLAIGVAAALLLTSPISRQSQHSDEVSVSQAERLVAAWLNAHKDQCPRNDHPKLKEITTTEIRQRLRAQVFRVRDNAWTLGGFDAYLVKDGKAYPMSVGFGGWGLMEMWVFDINGDSNEDLVYVYSFGSGMHRSMVEAYRFDAQSPKKIATNFAVLADIGLRKQNEHRLDVYSMNLRLGELIVAGSGKHQSLDIRLDPKLPKEWEKRIWRLDRNRAP